MHFMNPVPVMTLVELIRSIAATSTRRPSPPTHDLRQSSSARPRSRPRIFLGSFIVNRILMPMDQFEAGRYTLYEGCHRQRSGRRDRHGDEARRQPPDGPAPRCSPISSALDTRFSVMQVLYEGLADSEVPAMPAPRQIRRGRLARQKAERGISTTTTATCWCRRGERGLGDLWQRMRYLYAYRSDIIFGRRAR